MASGKGKQPRRKEGGEKGEPADGERDKREKQPGADSRLFYFNERTRQFRTPAGVAETCAKRCDERAVECAEKGDRSGAKVARMEADRWRALPSRASEEDMEKPCLNLVKSAREAMLRLFALSESPAGQTGLWQVVFEALSLLHDLAADGGAVPISILSSAVVSFQRLAEEKPEMFIPQTRFLDAFPGMVSPDPEKMKVTKDLVRNLRVGEKLLFPITGKRWKMTRANALAVGLAEQIHWHQKYPNHPHHGDDHSNPSWRAEAEKLKPFSAEPGVWKAWAEVAWLILDGGNHPVLYDPKTSICKVPKSRRQSFPSKPKPTRRFSTSKNPAEQFLNYLKVLPEKAIHPVHTSPSIPLNRIRTVLFEAFETIATGVSPRTKRRKRPRRTNG